MAAPTAPAKDDVFALYDDLKRRVMGISDKTDPPAGFMVSFLPCGLPINPDDYLHPWTPDLVLSDAPAPATAPDGAGAAPAQPDAAILSQITKRQRNLMNLSALVNKKLQMNGSGQEIPGSAKISETWWAILKGANARPLPPINDPVLKKQVDEATQLLMKPDPDDPEGLIETASYQRYKDYQRKYYRAVANYSAQYSAAMLSVVTAQTWPVVGKSAFAECESAMEDWVSLGKKDKIEAALDVLGSQGTDAASALIHSAKKNFERWQVAAGQINATIPFVQVFPSNWCDLKTDHDGWTEYKYYRTHSSSTGSSKSTGESAHAGFWFASANVSHKNASSHSEFTSDGVGLKMRYAVIDIERPWLNTTLLNLSNWFLVGFKKYAVSQGTIEQNNPVADAAFWLPAIPTQMIVIKDLKIRTSNTKAVHDAMKTSVEAGGSGGFLGFSCGGSYSNSSSQFSVVRDSEGEWLQVEGVQLIGWISQILPKSPQLDAPNA